MYILWARKKDKPDFEFITGFNNKQQEYYLIDQLREEYQEAIVVSEGGCELYIEFPDKRKVLKYERPK